ncbi:MAG: tetratricopeptide repeat protein [Planctomycetes bacterium]|nr:tetratricopeptide repeat protein [Planctomycetota bacterium]
MSHSPSDRTTPAPEAYRQGWDALFKMLYDGASFSGRERNCCFLNTGTTTFADVSAVSGLDFADDGRAVGVVDWDLDGSLDVWITNRTGPRVRFMRNVLQSGHHFVAVRLEGRDCNRDAIGARVEIYLHDEGGTTLSRTLRAGGGFLSQSSKWVHFGLGTCTSIDRLVVRWPGGTTEEFSDIEPDRRYLIVQGSQHAALWSPPVRTVHLTPAELSGPVVSDRVRIALAGRVPMPRLHYTDTAGSRAPLHRPGELTLINLWASWCAPCLTELADFAEHEKQIRRSGLRIVAVSVDDKADRAKADAILDDLSWPFDAGYAPPELLDQLDGLQRGLLNRKRRMPVPTSFLVDARGQLAVIYKGPVSATSLLNESSLVRDSAFAPKARFGSTESDEIMRSALPFPGRWHKRPTVAATSQLALAEEFTSLGYLELAQNFLGTVVDRLGAGTPSSSGATVALSTRTAASIAQAQLSLGVQFAKDGDYGRAIGAFREAVRLDPALGEAHFNLGIALKAVGRLPEAVVHYQHALEIKPNDAKTHNNLGKTYEAMGRLDLAVKHYRQAVACDPNEAKPHYNLAQALTQSRFLDDAVVEFRESLRLEPDAPAALNSLAWILATHPDPSRREASAAIGYAERAADLTGQRDPRVLQTLAAAYAADGDFDRARQTVQTALALATAAGNTGLANRIKKQLEKYTRAD